MSQVYDVKARIDAQVTSQRYPEHGLVPPPYAGSFVTSGQLALDFSYDIDFWGRNREALASAMNREMGKAIVGQERVLEELLIAIFARGHCLLVGVPGLAKTLMIRTLADSLSLSFSRLFDDTTFLVQPVELGGDP